MKPSEAKDIQYHAERAMNHLKKVTKLAQEVLTEEAHRRAIEARKLKMKSPLRG